jgi:hypothetical protein
MRSGCGGIACRIRWRVELAGSHIAVTAVAQTGPACTKEQRFVARRLDREKVMM